MGSRWCKISDGQQVVKPRIEQFFSQGRNCPKKLAIRKKSAILRILTWNFGNQMATQRESKSENLKKIQVLEPPQIDLRTEPKLVGTNGRSNLVENWVDKNWAFFSMKNPPFWGHFSRYGTVRALISCGFPSCKWPTSSTSCYFLFRQEVTPNTGFFSPIF